MSRKNVLKYFEEQKDYMNDRIENGIENNRKGYFTLNIKDKNDKPVTGAKVKIKLTNHEFKHGANLFMLDELETEEKNEKYKKYFSEIFNIATVPIYWDALEPIEGHPRFSVDSEKIWRRPATDLCVNYCLENNIEPKAHCLIYDNFSPKWINNLSIEKVKEKIEKRFEVLAAHYKEKIPSWEVLNELICWNEFHNQIFYENDLVEWAFKLAEKYFNQNSLLINEAHHLWSETDVEGGTYRGNRSNYYLMIERAMAKGARIDKIGMQFHMFFKKEVEENNSRIFYNPKHLYKVMDTYEKIGLPLQITETTFSAYEGGAENEEIQAELIKNIYSMWFSHKAMTGIIYWNVPDGYAFVNPKDTSWNENYYGGGLLRNDMSKKPAFDMIDDLFNKKWTTNTEASTNENGEADFKGFYGSYDVEIEKGGHTDKASVWCGEKEKKTINIKL